MHGNQEFQHRMYWGKKAPEAKGIRERGKRANEATDGSPLGGKKKTQERVIKIKEWGHGTKRAGQKAAVAESPKKKIGQFL